MILEEAVAAHTRWKVRLGQFLNGGSDPGINPATAHRDNLCELGCWLHGQGAIDYGGGSDFERLKVYHREFHEEVGRVVRTYAEDPAQAMEMLDGPRFRALSVAVVTAILKVKVDGVKRP
ncbi:CZB domain-containing protein [Mesoterricola silvestris]|uniref:CZB domain-containing protein n=1 Tax=Mesoterricola silvestris TaxID=2927979 RepID=UPI00292E819C|nr:CZB domain-containing protein [Mesoterricola silvestris]